MTRAERKALRGIVEGMEMEMATLNEGFTACPRCGHEDTTNDLDVAIALTRWIRTLSRMTRRKP